ncbi:MAG: DUF4864 domain-containing protein [Betaproteobacteria bacterium]|nr:DUF4864 domain-containing protein [Betaproteobacteria bacterium]
MHNHHDSHPARQRALPVWVGGLVLLAAVACGGLGAARASPGVPPSTRLATPSQSSKPAPSPSPQSLLSRADRNAIRTVITSQLKALVAEDDSAAFAMSAPDVRRQFGTAEAFGEMVREGYPALLKNQSTAFLEASVVGDDVIQPLRIVNRDGSVVIALFSMERQANGDWRVYGCELTPSDLRAV